MTADVSDSKGASLLLRRWASLIPERRRDVAKTIVDIGANDGFLTSLSRRALALAVTVQLSRYTKKRPPPFFWL